MKTFNVFEEAENFKAAIIAAGLTPPDSIEHDSPRVVRFSSSGAKGEKNGFYRFFSDGMPAGWFGCWRSLSTPQLWCAKVGNDGDRLTPEELEAMRKRREEIKAQQEAEIAKEQAEAANKALSRWRSCGPAPADHPYLIAKSIGPHLAKVTTPDAKYPEPSLILPITHPKPDGKGADILSLQFIRPDGSKTFLGGGKKHGGFCQLGVVAGASKILFAEGFATAATIHEATGLPVVVCFDAGNILPVVQAFSSRDKPPYSTFIICADDDWKTEGNPGISKAIAAARWLKEKALIAVPDFTGAERGNKDTDFNDLARILGAGAVADCIDKATGPDALEAAQDAKKIDVEDLIDRALIDIKVLFEPDIIKTLARWQKTNKAGFAGFKQALKNNGLQVIRDIEAAIRDHKQDHRAGKASAATKDAKSEQDREERFKDRFEVSIEIEKAVDRMEQVILSIPGSLYVRAGSLCRMTRGAKNPPGLKLESNAPTITLAPVHHLLELASIGALWFEWTKTKDGDVIEKLIAPPRWMGETLLARGSWRFPELVGMIEAPTLRSDGSLLEKAGYDALSGLFFDPGKVVFPAIADKPTLAEAKAAAETLLEVFQDFPFVADHDRSAALAFVLTLLCRHAIDGCTPLFLVRASTAGTGKSLLVDAAATIATGRKAARFAQEDSDEEARKRMFAIALAGVPLVLIDNVDRPLGSAALDGAITSGTIQDRILGKSETPVARWTAVCAATGNNVVVKGDLARRVCPIDLNAVMERPEERTGFKHESLLAWCAGNRGRLVAAGLTILRGYIAAGRPRQDVTPYGSFEQWSDLIRSSVVWLGLADPAGGRQKIRENSDPALDALREALQCWRAAFGPKVQTVAEVLREIDKHERGGADAAYVEALAQLKEALGAFDHKFAGLRINPRAVGKALAKHKDRIVDGLSFSQSTDLHKKVALWKVACASDVAAGFAGAAGFGYPYPASEPKRKDSPTTHSYNDSDGFNSYGSECGATAANPANPANPANHSGTQESNQQPGGDSSEPKPSVKADKTKRREVI